MRSSSVRTLTVAPVATIATFAIVVLVVVSGLGLTNSGDVAFAAAPPLTPAAKSDQPEVMVLLGEQRPLVVHLYLRSNGQPLATKYRELLDDIFRSVDKNKNGLIDQQEAQNLPPPFHLIRSDFVNFSNTSTFSRENLLAWSGQFHRAHLTAYYQQYGIMPFQIIDDSPIEFYLSPADPFENRFAPGRSMGRSSEQLTNKLFALLDTNKDGKLSREELAGSLSSLSSLDLNEDEWITAAEILGRPNENRDFAEIELFRGRPSQSEFPGPLALSVGFGKDDLTLAKSLLKKYGTVKDSKNIRSKVWENATPVTRLSLAQSGLSKERFASLDSNKDGSLDATELSRFGQGMPDLELEVDPSKTPPIRVLDRPNRAQAREGTGFTVRQRADLLELDLGIVRLELHCNFSSQKTKESEDPVLAQVIGQFRAADSDNNGYLDVNEAKRSVFRDSFKQMDKDKDGMLFEKEVRAFYEGMGKFGNAAQKATMHLSIQKVDQGLFSLLDRDGNGQLSLRELRRAPEIVRELDRDGDGYLSRAEFPRRYVGNFNPRAVFKSSYGVYARSTFFDEDFDKRLIPSTYAKVGNEGPVWFNKMDKNRDGDVSRREFLGTPEQFRAIDTDGDGLISVEEALAFDKKPKR